ncbi:hypothetical protein SSX86_032807 [Deinandra increscens subsp. villosa]|uniref:Uncharacterized protein n=1 Tax=Deinandra increscens subsp. villosa TaxID=3103831 RepID=A0AAP0C6I9_9ASTR
MSRQSNRGVDGLIPGYCKIRKRGCSSSTSSSSCNKVYNYRFKRAVMVGSRSSTPASSWRMTPSSSSSKLTVGGDGVRGVSARKLGATLWEVSEIPSPPPHNVEMRRRRETEKETGPVHTPVSILPSHLSSSHTPVSVSERMDGSDRTSISHRPRIKPNNGEVFDSHSNTSLMEIETRSRAPTPNASGNSIKPRLKEVSHALTTSKELLKVIHRMSAHDSLPSSSMSLISALHSELERARLQVNRIIKDQHVDYTEVNHVLKCFAEEKAQWKGKERRAVDNAIESISGELEVEKTLRRRSESLNKKLGQELAERKASFAKVLKELESEKRAREIMEQVCDELAVDIGEDRAEAEELKRESVRIHEEVEEEREMLQLADKLREERVQMKLAEAKHQFEEKNAIVDKLRSQLETVLGNKVTCEKKGRKDEDLMMHLRKSNFSVTRLNEEHDDGEVEDDLHSTDLKMNSSNKIHKWSHGHNFHKDLVDDETKWRTSVNNSVNGKASRRSTCSIQRSVSEGNEWGIQDSFVELEKQIARRSHGDDLQRYKSVKGLRDRILTNYEVKRF